MNLHVGPIDSIVDFKKRWIEIDETCTTEYEIAIPLRMIDNGVVKEFGLGNLWPLFKWKLDLLVRFLLIDMIVQHIFGVMFTVFIQIIPG